MSSSAYKRISRVKSVTITDWHPGARHVCWYVEVQVRKPLTDLPLSRAPNLEKSCAT